MGRQYRAGAADGLVRLDFEAMDAWLGLVAFHAEHDVVDTTVDGVVLSKPPFDLRWLNPSLHLDESAGSVGRAVAARSHRTDG